MSRELKIANPEGLYFMTWSTYDWVDVFSRMVYRDILLDSFRYCALRKGLNIYPDCRAFVTRDQWIPRLQRDSVCNA